MKYKKHTIPDKEIDKLMNTLDISLVEACELYLSDHDIVKDETVESLTRKANKNKITSVIHDAKGEKKERKAREKKENPVKKEIIGKIYDLFKVEYGDIMKVSLRNDEKYIDLSINNRNFTINLVEHRQKKGEK